MELLSISCLIFQLVETEDLDRNWRATRRERLKEQEKKIYEEFVQEKDVVYSVLEGTSLLFSFSPTCILSSATCILSLPTCILSDSTCVLSYSTCVLSSPTCILKFAHCILNLPTYILSLSTLTLLSDDRYQFIYELPETCIRELMETKPKASLKDDESSDTQVRGKKNV